MPPKVFYLVLLLIASTILTFLSSSLKVDGNASMVSLPKNPLSLALFKRSVDGDRGGSGSEYLMAEKKNGTEGKEKEEGPTIQNPNSPYLKANMSLAETQSKAGAYQQIEVLDKPLMDYNQDTNTAVPPIDETGRQGANIMAQESPAQFPRTPRRINSGIPGCPERYGLFFLNRDNLRVNQLYAKAKCASGGGPPPLLWPPPGWSFGRKNVVDSENNSSGGSSSHPTSRLPDLADEVLRRKEVVAWATSYKSDPNTTDPNAATQISADFNRTEHNLKVLNTKDDADIPPVNLVLPSQEWMDHAKTVFGEDLQFSVTQWEVFQALHPLPKVADETEKVQEEDPHQGRSLGDGDRNKPNQGSSKNQKEEEVGLISSGRYDFSIDWRKKVEVARYSDTERDFIATGNNLKTKEEQDASGNVCFFSQRTAQLPFSRKRFAQDGYSLVKFLWDHMFQKHGWVTTPIAGTGLGTYRHHGMFAHDDDMDMLVYPPLKYLLPPTLEERRRWKNIATGRGGEELMENSTYYKEQEALRNTPPPTPTRKPPSYRRFFRNTARPAPPPTPPPVIVPILKRDYSWPMTNLDTWRWVYDDFHEQVLEYKQMLLELGRESDFQWSLKGGQDMVSGDVFRKLHTETRFEHYDQNLRPGLRSCGFRYDSTNLTDLRRTFWNACLPNHFHLCLQPPTFLHEAASKHGPASMYTLGGHRGLGHLCKCRFGPLPSKGRDPLGPETFSADSDSHFMLCPPNLLSLVDSWYSKGWCVSTGPTQDGTQAVRDKSWDD